jgi:hypothetical protein
MVAGFCLLSAYPPLFASYKSAGNSMQKASLYVHLLCLVLVLALSRVLVLLYLVLLLFLCERLSLLLADSSSYMCAFAVARFR